MAQSIPEKSFLARTFRSMFPRLQIIRRGFTYEIIRPFGRVVCYAKGPYGIEKAWRELQEPGKVLQFKPRTEPKPLYQQRIDWINAKCKEMSQRVAEGRI